MTRSTWEIPKNGTVALARTHHGVAPHPTQSRNYTDKHATLQLQMEHIICDPRKMCARNSREHCCSHSFWQSFEDRLGVESQHLLELAWMFWKPRFGARSHSRWGIEAKVAAKRDSVKGTLEACYFGLCSSSGRCLWCVGAGAQLGSLVVYSYATLANAIILRQ